MYEVLKFKLALLNSWVVLAQTVNQSDCHYLQMQLTSHHLIFTDHL